MSAAAESEALAELAKRAESDGGFPGRPGGRARADSTAWAALALRAHGGHDAKVTAAVKRLAAWQQPDGRVPVLPEHPETSWTTALALWCWRDDREFMVNRGRGTAFLVGHRGETEKRTEKTPFSHDPTLAGWPWVDETAAWVEPTSFVLLALARGGQKDHARVGEGVRLVLDRRLPDGGWNYGNVEVLGARQTATLTGTGVVLCGLAPFSERPELEGAITWLEEASASVRTPASTAWAVLGLSTWGARPADTEARLAEARARSERYGPLDTTHLSLLLLAGRLERGLWPFLSEDAR